MKTSVGVMLLDKFDALPEEKQKRIIDGALKVFGQNVYKKASAGNIAEAAGISKGMVFRYFGSKKSLYLYLAELCGRILSGEMEKNYDASVTDFFDRMKMITLIKVSALKKHSGILSFLKKMYFETDPEVISEIRSLMSSGITDAWAMLLEGIDRSKFKDPAAIDILAKFITWAGEGAINDWEEGTDLDGRINGYIECLDLLKKNFYPPEGGYCNE